MEGLKCPICKAISLVKNIKDGELFKCPFCNYRFTVTLIRRYYLHPVKDKNTKLSLKDIENIISKLDNESLFKIMNLILEEMQIRTLSKDSILYLQQNHPSGDFVVTGE